MNCPLCESVRLFTFIARGKPDVTEESLCAMILSGPHEMHVSPHRLWIDRLLYQSWYWRGYCCLQSAGFWPGGTACKQKIHGFSISYYWAILDVSVSKLLPFTIKAKLRLIYWHQICYIAYLLKSTMLEINHTYKVFST